VEVEKLQVELLRAVKSLDIVEQSYRRAQELTEKTVLTELEQLQQALLKAHSALQLAAAAVERHQQLSDKVVARKELLAAQAEHQQARSAYDAAQRKLRTYGISEAQIRTMLAGGREQPVLANLGLSPQAAVQKYLILGNPGELFSLEVAYREKGTEVESLKRQLQLVGFSAADVASLIQRGVPNPTLTLTAPIAGTVTVREATLGAMVEPTAKLVEIVEASVMWVEGDIAEHLLAAVRTGQQARIRVAAYPEAVFTGTIRTIGRTVDPDKRTVHLWVEVANPHEQLLPEMFADVTLVMQAATEALAVPLQAVVTEGAEPFVFVENGDLYVRQPVVLGLKDDRYVEVREGLFPGDRVVVRGGHELNAVRTAATRQGQGGDGHAGHTH
jgi:multidrug efflux pump subunit AcrA (membrane-fusion protein)